MKAFFILYSFVFLSACSFYTLTNKSDQDLKIEKAGREEITLTAGACTELTEYFLGLGGDFPFVVNGQVDEQYGAGHYEIKRKEQAQESEVNATTNESANADSIVSNQYIVSMEEENPACSNNSKTQTNNSPVCGDTTQKAICSSNTTAQCILEKNKAVPACVNEKGVPVVSEKPSCSNKSLQAVCPSGAKKEGQINSKIKVLCLTGSPKCSPGTATAGCIKAETQNVLNTPACLDQNNKKIDSITPSCPYNKAPICLEPVTVEPAIGISLLCGGAQRGQCNGGGQAVCGKIPTDTVNKPYCVNSNNIRWSGDVHCSGNAVPICGAL